MTATIEESDLAAEIVEHLGAVRDRLAEEIRGYPTPIPRCDAQFNHLYEQQGRLLRDLDRIEATRESIERFVASAPYTDDPAERDFRARIKAALR
ncbi:MAG TPA: hypothetical protein VEC75_09985 [Stellaceae bacterium]|nr:hypothetical protein [Stellaceae bacterium]